MLERFNSISENRRNLSELDAIKVAQILEASPNEVYLFNQTTLQIEYANLRATKNLSYSLEQLQTMTVLDVETEFNRADFKRLVRPLVNREVTQINLETTHCRANGSTYPVEVYLQLVKAEGKLCFFAIVVDISQRKNAEQSLQDKTKELASVASNIPGAIYRLRYSQDGTINVEYVSDRAEDILELPLPEIYADFQQVVNLVHKDDRESFRTLLQKALTELMPFCWEGRMITPSQRLIWIQVRSQAQRQADGSMIRYGVLLDITVQKQAELALQESEEKFRQLTENIDDVFWMIDTKMTRLVYASPGFETIWGHSRQELAANPRNFLNWVHPEDRAAVKAAIPKQVLGEYDIEYRIIRPDGEIRWLRDRAFPVRDQTGNVYRVAGIAQDITDQKNAVIELSRNQELREVIFDEATDGLYLIDPDTLIVLDCNRRAVELLAAPNKEALLTKADYLYKEPFSNIEQTLAQQGMWNEELILVTCQGYQFWGDVAWKKILIGTQTTYLVRLTDISDRKSFEAELQTTNECLELTNQELEYATRLKDQFLANMSHEIRTPLNAILGMSEGLKEGSFDRISEQQQQAVKTIDTSARHLLSLINDILDLAKIQSGKVTLNFDQANIKSLCESSLTFVRQQAYQKGIQLQSEINTSISTLNVDELRIRQVLINLLTNAVKFTPPGGKVTLTVYESASRENVIFAVTDTGIGIAPDQMSQLFEPFVQLDSDFNRQHGGTGLGLSLVRRLSELHGGSVSVESEVGKGSTFYVNLPYTEVYFISNGDFSTLSTQEITDFCQSFSILVANCDQPRLDTTCSYLEASGYQVTAVDNREEIFSILNNSPPDMIVIDLPSFDWEETVLIQALRQSITVRPIPIIAITNQSAPQMQDQLFAAGATYCLVKPIRLRYLLNQIQSLLNEEFPQ